MLQQAICRTGMKQSGMNMYNLRKLLQLKCIIFWHKLQYRMSAWYNGSRLFHIVTSRETAVEALCCKRGELASGWLAADGCYTYGHPYGVWAETHQLGGGLRHGGGSSAQHSAQQADWGTAAKSNLFDKSDCRGWREGQRDCFTYWLSPRI